MRQSPTGHPSRQRGWAKGEVVAAARLAAGAQARAACRMCVGMAVCTANSSKNGTLLLHGCSVSVRVGGWLLLASVGGARSGPARASACRGKGLHVVLGAWSGSQPAKSVARKSCRTSHRASNRPKAAVAPAAAAAATTPTINERLPLSVPHVFSKCHVFGAVAADGGRLLRRECGSAWIASSGARHLDDCHATNTAAAIRWRGARASMLNVRRQIFSFPAMAACART